MKDLIVNLTLCFRMKMELYVDVMTREDAEKAGMLDLPWRNGSYLKDYSMVNDYQYWTEEWIYVRKKKGDFDFERRICGTRTYQHCTYEPEPATLSGFF